MSVNTMRIWKIIIRRKFLSSTSRLVARSVSRYSLNIDPLPSKYGGRSNVTVLPGVGVGPEIMESTLRVLQAADAPLSFEILSLPPDEEPSIEFENALTSIRRNRVALKGNIELKNRSPHAASRNVLLRKTLDLFAYVLHCKTYPGVRNRFGDFDVVVIRQNTEGEYLMLEHEPRSGTVESLKVVTRFSSERVAEFAFDYALKKGRRRVTVVHSADVHTLSEGLFVEAVLDVARRYPSVSVNVMDVSVAVIKIAEAPKSFDIILATNLNGGMVSHFLIGMLGGPGLSSGTNFADGGMAVFEPGARNKGSSIVGEGVANPVAMIMAGVQLLIHLGHRKTAEMIQQAVSSTLVQNKFHTPDLGGNATTKEITDSVIRHVKIVQSTPPKRSVQRGTWRFYCPVPDDFDVRKK